MNKTPENFTDYPTSIESEKLPHYTIMVTRHAERLPSGELSPEGIAHSKAKGKRLKDVEVLKSYVSDHPSGRTYETAGNISEKADIKSPLTHQHYRTKTVKGIQYDVLDSAILKEAKLLIEEATLIEIYSQHADLAQLIDLERDKDKDKILIKTNLKGEEMIDIEKLSKDIQRQIAPIRQKNQRLGFEKILNNPEAVKNMAKGLSHQLVGKKKILTRYSRRREVKNNAPKKDVVININTHGLFTESLLKSAGIFVKSNGEEIHGIDNMNADDLGGYIQPAESIYLDIGTDLSNIPERIPVIFEEKRNIKGKVFIDYSKLEQLDKNFNVNRSIK